jgi:hypothetical protein
MIWEDQKYKMKVNGRIKESLSQTLLELENKAEP